MPLFDHKIFFGNPVDQFTAHREEILVAIENVCTQGPHILGPVVEKFEHEFAAWNGSKYAVGVGSGTDALVLALKAFGIGAGDEVITVSHTALATIAAIVLTGAKPVLVDVHPDTAVMNPAHLDAVMTSRTKAIIPVHLYGFVCPMDEILTFARKNKLVVIEDCAQAHGARYKGQNVGTIGDAGCFSFYPTKNLGAIGDGGAVITNDEKIAENVRQRRQYGWNESRVSHVTGSLSRLDALQAAVLSVKLKYLSADNGSRCKIAELYNEVINWDALSRPQALPGVDPVYHLYVIAAENRESIRVALAKENVELGIHYAHPAHLHPAYAEYVGLPAGGLPVTEKLSQTVLSLPIYPEFSLSSAKKIAEFLNAR